MTVYPLDLWVGCAVAYPTGDALTVAGTPWLVNPDTVAVPVESPVQAVVYYDRATPVETKEP